MSRSFAGLSPPEYDRWRRSAEFYLIESAIIAPMLSGLTPKRVLDLGCGTGTWSRRVAELYPATEVIGVDISQAMVKYARQSSGPRLKFEVDDCCKLKPLGTFDLIICAMSADYIGFECLARAIVSTLARSGVALLWVFDPTTYEVRNGQRIKKWVVGGKVVHAAAAIFDPVAVYDHFVASGLCVETSSHDVRLSDGKPRRLVVSALRWATSEIAV